MENNQWVKRIIAFGIVLTTVVTVSIMYWIWNRNAIEDVRFSEEGYFYQETIKLKLASKWGAKIYYTLDGSVPDDTDMLYNGPIYLEAEEEELVYPVSAVAYFRDGTKSDVIVHNYVVGQSVESRYDTCVVFLTTEPDNFFDEETGIYVEGNHMNYRFSGRESERPVHVEIANSGNDVIALNAGARISGNISRGLFQKSLKLYARYAYDTENRFRGSIFPDVTDSLGQAATEYQRLLLRNSGNDFCAGFIRDTLAHELAQNCGYPGTKSAIPCCAYVNGEYLGFYWLQEVYDEEWFENHYRKYDGEFRIFEGSEFPSDEINSKNDAETGADYEEMYQYALKDLTVEENFAKLCELVDIEDYLQYNAIQLYIGAGDWQNNNFMAYRYLPASEEEGQKALFDEKEAPFDGKWRFLLHDMDVSFAIYEVGPEVVNIEEYANNESTLFGHLMQREDCRQYFVNYTLHLMNTGFEAGNFEETLDRLLQIRKNEMSHFYWTDFVDYSETVIREYGLERAKWVREGYGEYFGYGTPYEVSVVAPENTELYINGIKNENEFCGSFLDGLEVEISTLPETGYEIDYWKVNGEKAASEKIVLQQSDIQDGNVQIELVIRESGQELPLLVSEFSSKGDEDYIVLRNPNSHPVSTTGYSLSDTRENPDKQPLQKTEIPPHAEITIRCSNAKSADSKDLLVDFALKTGETICLSKDGTVLEEILIPDIKEGNYLVKNLCTGEFYAKSK